MPKMIEFNEVQRLLGEGAQLLDVMSREAYVHSHVPGAIPLKEFDEQSAARLTRSADHHLLLRLPVRHERTSRVATRRTRLHGRL